MSKIRFNRLKFNRVHEAPTHSCICACSYKNQWPWYYWCRYLVIHIFIYSVRNLFGCSNNFFFLHRITSRFPDDPRQPFWNETGAPMKPLAKLSLTRQRLYRKSCIKDNDIPFQETIVPVDLYEDHQGGMYCKLLWRILDDTLFVYSAKKTLSKTWWLFRNYLEKVCQTTKIRFKKFGMYQILFWL